MKTLPVLLLFATSLAAHDLATTDREALRAHILEEWKRERGMTEVASTASVVQLAAAAAANAANAPQTAKAFLPFTKLDLRADGEFLYVGSNGMPDHNMMVGITAWQQQVPLPQPYFDDNAWRIPLKPVPAKEPAMIKGRFLRGAIALAVNGIPIFNPQNNRGEVSYEIGELDEWGGHCGRADDYHYHIAPLHLQAQAGRGMPVAYALDGYPIYGLTEPDGSPVADLDECHGHESPSGYHYHASNKYPYVIGGFHGEVVEAGEQVDPQPRAQGVREALTALRGAKITAFESTGKDSYKLSYDVNGDKRSVSYSIKADGTYPFHFDNGREGTADEVYTARRQGGGGGGGGGDRPPGGGGPEGMKGKGKGKGKGEAKGKGGKNAVAANAPLPGSVLFPMNDALDPSKAALSVEAWVLPDKPNGTILHHGGPLRGYALDIRDNKPQWHIRSDSKLSTIISSEALTDGWHHIAATLTAEGKMALYIDAKLVAEGSSSSIDSKPARPLYLGNGEGAPEGNPGGFSGLMDQFALYHKALSPAEVQQRFEAPDAKPVDAILVCNFDNGDSRDSSGNSIHGIGSGLETGKGKVGGALWFKAAAAAGKGGVPEKGSFVKHTWDRFVPIVARSMALAGKTVLVSGAPDTIDEEYAFERLAAKDPAILQELKEQDEALEGKRGAKMWAVNTETGEQSTGLELTSPPVWDGITVAQGRVYVSTMDGRLQCFGK